jgi:predicted RNA-binding Zn-ribbon protein involved in translation (DUF1610 family)
MQDALERISKKIVNAENALRIHDYVCPECGAPVILRAGYERTAYFAHASGFSDEDCARYAAGFGNATAHTHTGIPHDYVDALQLQLRIKRNGFEYGWALDIVVPTYKVNYGSIVIDVGGRTNEINLDGNLSLYRTIAAAPQASPYRIVEVKPAHSRLSFLEKTCPALDGNFATVFGSIDRPDASGIPKSTTLQPERTYAFIWPTSCIPIFPEELGVELLSSAEQWCGALVTIPHQVSTECAVWLEQFTRLKFVSAAPAIIPVWPPIVRSLTALRIEALPQLPFSFFVEHSGGTPAPPLFARSAQAERVAKAYSNNAPLYELSPEGAKNVQLMCTNGPRLDVDFQLDVSQLKNLRPGIVKLTACDKGGKAVESVLHSCDANKWFSQIRCGELSFKSMTMPKGARGHVKVFRNAEWVSELEFLGDGISQISPTSAMNANVDLAHQLIAFVLDPTLSVLIDFSSLGRAVIRRTANSALEEKVDAPAAILPRIRQYFIQFPETLPAHSRWHKLPDNQLLAEFQNSKPTKKSLAHYRFIANTIPRKN